MLNMLNAEATRDRTMLDEIAMRYQSMGISSYQYAALATRQKIRLNSAILNIFTPFILSLRTTS